MRMRNTRKKGLCKVMQEFWLGYVLWPMGVDQIEKRVLCRRTGSGLGRCARNPSIGRSCMALFGSLDGVGEILEYEIDVLYQMICR